MRPRFVVVALTARPRTEEAYRATYVDGMLRALDALEVPPERAVLVSSTAVMPSGDQPPLDDETTPAAPSDGPGRSWSLRRRRSTTAIPHGTVLRLSGLYGGSSTRLLDQVREGRIDDPHRWTNRIHREDAAAAVVHLLTMDASPAGLYLGTDDEPAQLGDVAAYLAERPGRTRSPPADPRRGTASGCPTRGSAHGLGADAYASSYREGYAGDASDDDASHGDRVAARDGDDLAGDVARLGEARKTNAVATSAGCPARPSGVSSPNDAILSSGIVAGISGVQIGPGATELTRMPFSATDCARPRVKFTMPALVVA